MPTSGSGQRLDVGPLWLDLKRYKDENDKALWRLIVRRFVSGEPLIEQDATLEGLMALKHFAEQGIEELRTDGGRTEDQ